MPFKGLKLDPITGRDIAWPCWNGFHEDEAGSSGECDNEKCKCGCHAAIETPILAD
jgi:hypothetical protein